MEYLLEVNYKPKFFDALGNTVKKNIEDLGIFGIKKVKTAQLYHIKGELKEKELELLCKELLTDKITQQYTIRPLLPSPPASCFPPPCRDFRKKAAWEKGKGFVVQVWYKKGVTDAVADTVKKGATDLGVAGINTVKTGCEYTIIGNISREQIERICKGLLANKVVQDYKIYE